MQTFNSRLKHLAEKLPDIPDMSVQESLSHDPVTWTEQVRILRGHKFTFDKRDYLLQIMRDLSPEIYIAKGRQTEVSELAVNWLLHRGWRWAQSVGLYVAARGSQTSKFSNLRVKKWALQASPILNEIAPARNHSATQLTYSNMSELFFHSAWEGFEEARSVPADYGVVDEIQSTNIGDLDVMRETLGHVNPYSNIPKQLLCIGTGSTGGSDWDLLFKSGKQYHWSWESKSWIAKNPTAKYSSYWIPQTIVSWITPEEIEEKRKKMTYFRYMTEVMGEFPEGQAKPITEQMMLKCLDRTKSFALPNEIDRTIGFLTDGTDWGGGENAYTVWWLMQEVKGKFYLKYAEKIDEPDVAKQAKIIEARRKAYMPDRGVMDAGGGTYQVQELQKVFGHDLTKALYMIRPQEPYELKDVWEKNLIQVDRTFSIETLIDIIKNQNLIIPAQEMNKVEWIIDMFTAIEAETATIRAGGSHTRFIHDDANPDDALHAFNYAKLANYLMHKKAQKKGYSSTGKFGR